MEQLMENNTRLVQRLRDTVPGDVRELHEKKKGEASSEIIIENGTKKRPHQVLRVASWNINRGFVKKQGEIESFLSENEIDILGLQETNLLHYSDDNPVRIEGYETYSNLRSSKQEYTRMILFIKNGLSHSMRSDLMSADFCSVWLEVGIGRGPGSLIGFFYREWTDVTNDKSIIHQREQLQLLLDQFTRASEEKKLVVCMGDMNIDMNKREKSDYPVGKLLRDLEMTLANSGLENIELGDTYFAFRTREDGSSISSALDHLYINDHDALDSFEVLKSGMSDHRPIMANVRMKRIRHKTDAIIKKRCYKRFNWDNFKQDLVTQPWEQLGETEDVNIMVDMFTCFFLSALDKHAPIKEIKLTNRSQKMIKLSDECKLVMKSRDLIASQIKDRESTPKDILSKYKSLRNKATKMIRQEKRESIGREINQNPTSKNIWKVINKNIKKSKEHQIKLEEAGKEIDSPAEIAEIFNLYFKEKIEGLRNKINPEFVRDPLSHMEEKVGQKKLYFHLYQVSDNKVLQILKNLKSKTSSGFDGISTELLKKVADIIHIPLTRIINSSISTGVFPEAWKLALVKPILKKGTKTDKANYRPVSLLPAASLILEKVIRYQIEDFMEREGLFPNCQFGFRKDKCTIDALISLHSKCLLDRDLGKTNLIAMYDLSAAFDCLDPEILIKKLKIYGFNRLSLSWIESYLSNRKQKVCIENESSGLTMLPFGCPQGSCLSPTLFLALMADINLWTQTSEIIGYCDDTTQVVSASSEQEAVQMFEEDSKTLVEFMSSNRLAINPSKTCIMIATPSSVPTTSEAKIGNEMIPFQTSSKLLGMQISNSLKWNSHVDRLTKELAQRIGIIRRLKEVINVKELITVGEGIVNSKFRYGMALYCPVQTHREEAKGTILRDLQVLQNTLMRVILGKKITDQVPIRELLDRTGYLSINQMSAYHKLTEMFGILRRDSVPFLSNVISWAKRSVYNTRFDQEHSVSAPVMKRKKNEGFITGGTSLWNELPESIRKLTSKKLFCDNIKEWIKKNIPI
jgi:hypothetical protein